MGKENKKLKKENANLRDAISVMDELPELLQKIRTVKGKSSSPNQPLQPVQPPKKQQSPVLPTEASSPPVTCTRQPLAALNTGNNETIQFGAKEVSKKELSCTDFRKPSAVVKFLMQSLFEEEELETSSLTGSHGGTRKGQDSKPALDKETVIAIVEFTKSHCRITEDDVKKMMRIRLNNIQKRLKKSMED